MLEPNFQHDKSEYTRNFFHLPHYQEQVAFYISKKAGISYEEAYEYVMTKFRTGEVAPSERKAYILAKDENGDRYKKVTTLFSYFSTIHKKNLRVVPTLTVYELNEAERKISHYGNYAKEKAALRKGFKKLKFVYAMKGDKANESFYDSLQNSCKIKVNSISGMHSSAGTVGFIKSGHSTLTSTCRIITSTANSMNEKFIAGNRHYYSPLVTLSNIITLGNDARNHEVEKAIKHYNLKYPTTRDVMECIRRSCSYYWLNEDAIGHIEKLVDNLSDNEKAFFYYGMDMYHLEKLNPSLIKELFEDFSIIGEGDIQNAKEFLGNIHNEDLEILSLLNCAEIIKGITLSDLEKEHPEKYNIFASTAEKLVNVHNKYALLFRVFFRPNVLPASIYRIESMYRRAVPLSDTDSCVFTNQEWLLKYFPDDYESHKANCINYTMTYFITQIVAHGIAQISMNIGLKNEQIGGLAMKNEFCFPVLWLTENTKHYYALKSAQEGNIYPVMKDEVKGVNLRNSAASVDINKELKTFMRDNSETISRGELLNFREIHRKIAELEHMVLVDCLKGGTNYLRSVQIKEEDAYTRGEDEPAVKQHQMWEEVFAPKYGRAPDLPYRAISLTLSTSSKTKINNWLETITDLALRERMREWLEKNNKKDLSTVRLPVDVIASIGIPKEFLNVAEFRDIIRMIINPFYILLSSFGITPINELSTKLLSDDYEDINYETTLYNVHKTVL